MTRSSITSLTELDMTARKSIIKKHFQNHKQKNSIKYHLVSEFTKAIENWIESTISNEVEENLSDAEHIIDNLLHKLMFYLCFFSNSLNLSYLQLLLTESRFEQKVSVACNFIKIETLVQALRSREGGEGGRDGVCPPKFSENVPFFSKSPLNVPFLKILNLK